MLTSTTKDTLSTAQAHLEPTGTPHSGTPDIDTRQVREVNVNS